MEIAAVGLRRVLESGFEAVLARLPEALKAEGFGVLTEIDVKQTLATKLGVDFRRYRILGACNPPLAHRALEADLEIGLMLPCNVVVYEGDDGRTVVSAVDPERMAPTGADPRVRAVAAEVKGKLESVLARLA